MRSIDTVVIGAGQAGLAMSHCLGARGHDHVVLERGRLAERWRSARWDSMRLLSPNWMTRLPGWSYTGPDPDGFMRAAEVVDQFVRYASASDAPIEEHSPVVALTAEDQGFAVQTDGARWTANNVVLATGWCDLPAVPPMSSALAPEVFQVTPDRYRDPALLPDGGALVVGASATGVQLAAELRAAGRDVVLAVGDHTRMPRSYRGMDILWWLELLGKFDVTIDEVTDISAARRQPSMQLAAGRSLDLPTLRTLGVELVGRVVATDGSRVRCADNLASRSAAADRRLHRLLDEIDAHVASHGLEAEVLAPERPASLPITASAEDLDLEACGISTVLWATGHRRAYPWLQVPVLDGRGEIVQRHGITACPGLYTLGQRFQRRRSSDFIDGVGRDAVELADVIATRPSRVLR